LEDLNLRPSDNGDRDVYHCPKYTPGASCAAGVPCNTAMAGIRNRFGAPTILECWSQHLVRKFESVLAPPAHGLRGEIAHSVLVVGRVLRGRTNQRRSQPSWHKFS